MGVFIGAVMVVLLAIGLWLAYRRRRRRAVEQPWLPSDLRGARLAYAEASFRSRTHGLVARIDRAYRHGNGELTLVELKTRGRAVVHRSDVIELSVQRLVIQDQEGHVVSMRAYVVVQQTDAAVKVPIRVQLFTADEVDALRDRYEAITAGKLNRPRAARALRQCEQCGHREVCSMEYGDHAAGEPGRETSQRS